MIFHCYDNSEIKNVKVLKLKVSVSLFVCEKNVDDTIQWTIIPFKSASCAGIFNFGVVFDYQ